MIPLFGATVHAAMDSAAKSYVYALVIITVLMVLFIGDLRMGLVSMIPNLMPIILTMGIMGAAGLPMDMFTMLIGAIAIGLAVDDTIHFMHNFRRYYEESGDARDAVLRTLLSTGRAMLVTSVVLSLGFFIFAMASMYNLQRFGILTGFTIVTALIADFLVSPALMMVLHRPAGESAELSVRSDTNAECGVRND
jgi:predicted RND superfamily exporter protein